MTDLRHSKVKLNSSMKTQSQPQLHGECSANSLEKWFSDLFSYPWSQWKWALLGVNTQCPEWDCGLCALLPLYLWFEEGEITFFSSECFRKINWTNAKITGNSSHHNISSLCLGSVLQQHARLLQSLSNLDFPPWKFRYETQGGISWQCVTSLPLYGVKSPSLASNSLCPSSGWWQPADLSLAKQTF